MHAYFTSSAEQPAPAPASPPPTTTTSPTTTATTAANNITAQAQPSEEPPAGTEIVLGAGVGRLQRRYCVYRPVPSWEKKR